MEHPPSDSELRVLDAALDEELDGITPPDLWPRVRAAMAAPTPSTAGATRRRFWFALAMAVASAVVVAVWLDSARSGARNESDGNGSDPRLLPARSAPRVDVDAKGPLDLVELQRWLAAGELRGASIRAENVFAPALGRSVPMSMMDGLEGLFESGTTAHLRFADRAELAAALQRAAPAALPRTSRPWEHVVDLTLGEHHVRLLVRGDVDGALHFAVAAPGGAFGVALDGVAALLEPELREVTAATIAARGIAIGDDGFDALPATATRLRLHDVSRAAVDRIGRFAALRSLDLRDAPDWHEARVVRALAALPLQTPLQTLLLDGTRLDAAGVAALGTFTQLRELFVLGPGDLLAQTFAPSPPVLPARIAAAVAQLPQLEELMLVDGGLTDADLAQLARMPALRRLGVAAGARMDGSGLRAFAGHPLRSLGLQGPLTAASLAAIRALPALESLTLLAMPPLRADDLPSLYGATQLKRLELFAADSLDENARAALRAALPQCRVSFESRP